MRQRPIAIALLAALALAGCGTAATRGPAASAFAAPAEPGLEWIRAETGRDVPDATGVRFFKPALSGGTGVQF